MTPEQKDELAKTIAENRARQEAMTRKEDFEKGRFTLELVAVPDEPQGADEAFQLGLSKFSKTLHEAGIEYGQHAIAMDSVESLGYALPEYSIHFSSLAVPTIGVIGVAVGAWINGRYGRKARLKIGDVEAEGRTPEEVEKLLEMAAKHKGHVRP